MGDCFEFLKNNTLSRADLNGENGTARNVHYGDILIKFGDCLDGERSDLPFITDDTVLPKFAGSILREGDVIFADTAEDEAAGKCVELRKLPKEPTISGLHTIPARPRFPFGMGYLGHYLNSDAYHRQLLPLMQGIKVISVSKAALQDTQVRFPGLSEQTAIGAALSEIDAPITLHQRKCQYRGLYGYLSWEQRKLGDVATITRGERFTAADYVKSDGIPCIHYGEIYTDYGTVATKTISQVKPSLRSSLRYAKPGDVIVATTSENVEDVCKAVAWIGNSPVAYHDDSFALTFSGDPVFLVSFFETSGFYAQKSSVAHGVKVMRVSSDSLANINLPTPLVVEQRLIGSYFSRLDFLITLHQ